MSTPRFLNAGNTGFFTFGGTRTYLVGQRRVAVLDPGPDAPEHVEALTEALVGADEVRIVLTHHHDDHAGAAPALSLTVGAEVSGPSGIEGVDHVLSDGDRVETDQGTLVAVHAPGHTREHLCFHWPERRALFAGDHVLGHGDTTWVAGYPGCVRDYLASIERLRAFDLEVIYPAHGPPLSDPTDALDRFERHRRDRIRQVEAALEERPDVTVDDLMDHVYGAALPDSMRSAAAQSLGALLEHVRG